MHKVQLDQRNVSIWEAHNMHLKTDRHAALGVEFTPDTDDSRARCKPVKYGIKYRCICTCFI